MSAPATATLPDAGGHFGRYGGRFVPETLMQPLQQLEEEYFRAQQDPEFQRELNYYLREFCGRPTPLYFAERLTRELGGPKIYLKREDLLHTGAHKINNAMGQILLAKRMGKTRIIAEEARRQILEKEEHMPDLLIACVGGGSNAIGLFYPFLEDASVKMLGVEAGGLGIMPEQHAARFHGGSLGVLQGTRSYIL